MELEICCGDLNSVLEAQKGGANRIELCSGLAEGGLTPSIGLIKAAVESGIQQVNVLIRPRPGDFLYSDAEIQLMINDIKSAVKAGANGIVIGVLKPDGEIDVKTCQRLIDTAMLTARDCNLKKPHVTFHRAFDVSRAPYRSLDAIISLGCDTLLTSGMAPSALQGIETIKDLVKHSDGKIVIMAGSGVNTSNAAQIIADTGVGAIHSTARRPTPSLMTFHRESVPMGAPGVNEYAPPSTAADIVANLRQITYQQPF